MVRLLIKKLKFLTMKAENSRTVPNAEDDALSEDLAINLDRLKVILGNSGDVILREFSFGSKKEMKSALVFIDGLIDKNSVNDNVIKPLMYQSRMAFKEDPSKLHNIDYIRTALMSVVNIKQTSSMEQVVDDCLSGNTVFLLNGSDQALTIASYGWKTRSIEEPKTEAVVRGPREGFTETLATNIALLRRKIKSSDLSFISMTIGKRTKTFVSIAYVKGLANESLIQEIKYRLGKINTDSILESGYIEQFIEDAPFSIFPTVGNSEKPDTVAAKLLEGRAAVLVDGTPFVLTVPLLFIENFQSAEDYYSRPYFASLIRMLRFLAYTISILAPAIYVILSSFHQELIPTPLLFTMAAAHEGVPFSAAIEAGIMIITFEILREAGVRLPRPVGQAVSIVGALVIGESAVSAGLIGAPMVIVVAITAVSSFVIPAQTDATAILRIVMLILAGFMGGFGLLVGLLGLMVHLVSLRSFGSPYLSPMAPLTVRDLKDLFIRAPIWAMLNRPRAIIWKDSQRQGTDNRPQKPDND